MHCLTVCNGSLIFSCQSSDTEPNLASDNKIEFVNNFFLSKSPTQLYTSIQCIIHFSAQEEITDT